MLSYTDSTIRFESQTRVVYNPKRVFDSLHDMGIEFQNKIQARRMFDKVCNLVAKVHVFYDESGVTFEGAGTFTRIVKNPKFICGRLKHMGIEAMEPVMAKRLFDRGCSFYDSQDKLALVFVKGQQVRHKVLHSIRIATYNDTLLWNDHSFSSLYKFVSNHYSQVHPSRKNGNSWAECETLVGDKWVSLREFYFGGVSL
jgi:hypothetical protein